MPHNHYYDYRSLVVLKKIKKSNHLLTIAVCINICFPLQKIGLFKKREREREREREKKKGVNFLFLVKLVS